MLVGLTRGSATYNKSLRGASPRVGNYLHVSRAATASNAGQRRPVEMKSLAEFIFDERRRSRGENGAETVAPWRYPRSNERDKG